MSYLINESSDMYKTREIYNLAEYAKADERCFPSKKMPCITDTIILEKVTQNGEQHCAKIYPEKCESDFVVVGANSPHSMYYSCAPSSTVYSEPV